MSAALPDQIRQLAQAFDEWIEEVTIHKVSASQPGTDQPDLGEPGSTTATNRTSPIRYALVAACFLLVFGLGLSLAWIRSGDASRTPVGSGAVAEPSAPTVYVPSAALPPTAPIEKHPIRAPLSKGSSGDDVSRLQQRLLELGLDPGDVDGTFGEYTEQAVWAYEKLVLGVARTEVTGVVTPTMWDKMQDPVQIVPRHPLGDINHVEIYLPEQVMVIFHADQPVLVAHVSTGAVDDYGNPADFCEIGAAGTNTRIVDGPVTTDPSHPGGVCGVAETPGGQFEIVRMIKDREVAPVGGKTNPAYFTDEIAIYGSDVVPNYPASHGGVRINQDLAEKFQSLLAVGDPVLVWDGTHEP